MAPILVVEDHPLIRELLAEWLELRGYTVTIAVDGAQALAMARSGPDLVLLDMDLPVIDGWQVVRHLKADPVTAAIPVIALTAHATIGDRERCLAAGCDDYAAKPIAMNALIGQMTALLTARRAKTDYRPSTP